MLDPNKLIAMLAESAKMSQTSQSSLSDAFIKGAAGMNINSADLMQQIMSTISSSQAQSSQELSKMMSQFPQAESAQQAVQQAAAAMKSPAGATTPGENPVSPNPEDLMKSVMAGFPAESMAFFEKISKG